MDQLVHRARHPLEHLKVANRPRALVTWLGFSLICLWGLHLLEPRTIAGSLLQLSTSDSAARVRDIIGSWLQTQSLAARLWLSLDCLFAVSYSVTLSIGCLMLVPRPLPRFGRFGAWVATLAGLVDLGENLELFQVLHNQGPAPLRWIWVTKFILVGIALTIGLVGIGVFLSESLEKRKERAAAKEDQRRLFQSAQSEGSARVLQVSKDAPAEAPRGKELKRWLLGEPRQSALPGVVAVLRPPDRSLGVCCSGGGIRSAAYCLGALQVLDRRGELARSTYLAGVSGGSYIASAHETLRARGDYDALPGPDGLPLPAFAAGSPEERHLRNRTTYLAPGAGGKWAFLWRLFRGLMVNLAIIVSAVALAGAFYGKLIASPVIQDDYKCQVALCPSPSGRTGLYVLAVAALAIVFGLVSMLTKPTVWRFGSALEAWSLRLVNLAIGLLILLIVLPWIIVEVESRVPGTGSGVSRSAIVTLGAASWAAILGAVSFLVSLKTLAAEFRPKDKKKEKSKGSAKEEATATKGRSMSSWIKSFVSHVAVAIAGPLLGVALFVAYAFMVVYPKESNLFRGSIVVFALVLYSAAVWSDLSKWSAHPYYKRRLSSVFALERKKLADESVIAREVPYSDAMAFTELKCSPTLVVCAAANVSDYGVVPTSRRAVPFIFSSEGVFGGELFGEMSMARYRAAPAVPSRDTSIRAAVAMSGAAVSPSMGKFNKTWLRFALAVANVRLGVWLPTPKAVQREYELGKRVPRRVGLRYLLWEMVGRNSVRDDFVYVTDGGHVENLGLVELLRRGCTDIYCIDASGDKVDTFNTLNEAFAMARSELLIEVELDTFEMVPTAGSAPYVAKECMVGRFWYDRDDRCADVPGRIVVLKAGVASDAPSDLRAFMAKDPEFPTHGTASQLYSEERFEAYRALGANTASRAVALMAERWPPVDEEPRGS